MADAEVILDNPKLTYKFTKKNDKENNKVDVKNILEFAGHSKQYQCILESVLTKP